MTREVQGEALQRRRAKQLEAENRAGDDLDEGDRPVRLTQTLDGVKLKLVGETWMPVKGVCTVTVLYADGSRSVTTTRIERTKIELNPDTTGESFIPEIPNGTPVRFVGEATIMAREWRDGKIIPREDKEATARLRAIVGGQHFTTDSAETSQLSLLRGQALFAAGAALITLAPAAHRRLSRLRP